MDGWNCVDLVIVRGGPGVSPEFVARSLNAARRSTAVASASSGSIQQHFGAGAVRSLRVPYLPLNAQEGLAKELTALQNAARSRARQLSASIELLTEYKSSLITAAVTGELDVTTASSNLPE